MKKAIAALCVLLTLAATGLVVFLMTLDVNQYKPQIISSVESATGRSVTVEGDIGMKLSLVPTISISGMTLGNAGWGKREHLARVGRFEAQAALMPLLRKEIIIRNLMLSDAVLNLEVNDDGVGNWTMSAPQSGPKTANPFPNAVLESVSLRNIRISYAEPARAQALTIALKTIDITSTGMDDPLDIIVEASLDDLPVQVAGKLGAVASLLADKPCLVDLTGTAGALDFSLAGSIEHPLSAAGVKLTLNASAPDLASLGDIIGRELAPVSPVSIAADISNEAETLSFANLNAQLGASDVRGALRFTAGTLRGHVQAELKSTRLDLVELFPEGDAGSGSNADGERLFSTEPLPLDTLRAINADIDLELGMLVSRSLIAETVGARLQLTDGKLTLPELKARVADGNLTADLTLDASTDIPVFNHSLVIQAMNLSSLPTVAEKNLIDGGITDIDVSLTGKGKSPAAIMGSANGKLLVRVGPGRLTNAAMQAGSMDILLSTLRLLNPLSSESESTKLECAVINLPVKAGVAKNDTGIALLTSQLSVLGGGSINFGTEAIDIGAKPRPREGVGINVAGLSDFMRIGGTLSDPRAVTDAKGAALGAARIGAAVATGGLSILAEGIVDRSIADEDVCGIALGTRSRSSGAGNQDAAQDKGVLEATSEKAAQGVEAAAEGVRKVFKGLFGD